MRQAVLSLAIVLIFAMIGPVRGQTPSAPTANAWTSDAATAPAGGTVPGEPLGRTFNRTQTPGRFNVDGIVASMITRPTVRTSWLMSELQGVAPDPIGVPGPLLDAELTTTEVDTVLLQEPVEEFGPTLQALGPRPMSVVAQRDVAAGEQIKYPGIAGVFTYKFKKAAVPAAVGGTNYNGPGADSATTHEVSLELGFTLAPNPNASLFADLSTKYTSDSGMTTIDWERFHLTLRDTLGVHGLNSRIGRDAIRLGADGLLLEEVLHDGDRRDGVQVWLPAIGAVKVTGFWQFAIDDRTTSQRLWGGRAEADVHGWILGLNYRADTPSASDAGTCPGPACNTGKGFGVDLEGTIIPGVGLTLAYASYTQTSDIARTYYQADLVLDLDQLVGPDSLHPVLTVWYKAFDPYTIPGADGTVPRGGFLTPDDFKLFNVNDNLTAVGSRVDLQLTSNLAVLALGEWGTYKGGGPAFNVYSVGLRYSFPQSIIVKLTYNAYAVAGGSVTTSPISGIQLSNAIVYQLEVTKGW